MNGTWLQCAALRVASLLAPGDQRAEWLEEWHSELWYVPPRSATWFCLGAFRDAFWLRRNNLSPAKPRQMRLESPLRCLAFLAAVAALSTGIAFLLPLPPGLTPSPHLRATDLPAGFFGMLAYTGLLLPIMGLVMGRAPVNAHAGPWPGRLRRAIFMALKVALLQPVMFCGFLVLVNAGTLPITPSAVCAGWMLALRWTLADQRRRCPVCLRLLSNPVRIGSPSRTFLDWYGAETICSRGHGLLQVPEIASSYSGRGQWLRLGRSWSSLFAPAAGARR
jgi:hypothetical protein